MAKPKDLDALPATYADCQKRFLKTLHAMSVRYAPSAVLADFVEMSAIAFQNQTELNRARHEEREKAYLALAEKHGQETARRFPELLALMIKAFSIQVGDFLGEVYMQIEAGNKHAGQFFTPYDISRLMSKISYNEEMVQAAIAEKGYVTVNDCACGAGSTLTAFVAEMEKRGHDPYAQALVVANDIDRRCALMCYVSLSAMGVPGIVTVGDALYNTVSERWETLAYRVQYLRFAGFGRGGAQGREQGDTKDEQNRDTSISAPAQNPGETAEGDMKEAQNRATSILPDEPPPPREAARGYEQLTLF
ncbi:MAG: N-6 DNA methylase [Candidatus Spyradenecus sp.]